MGQKGYDVCPKYTSKIITQEECERASQALGYDYNRGQSMKEDPNNPDILCHICTDCDPYLTRVSTAHGPNSFWVCKDGKCLIGKFF